MTADTQYGNGQKNADADSDRPDQNIVRDGSYLIGQHLQVRLGDGDDCT